MELPVLNSLIILQFIGEEYSGEDVRFRDRRSWKDRPRSRSHWDRVWKGYDNTNMSGSETGSEDQGPRGGRGGGGPAGGKRELSFKSSLRIIYACMLGARNLIFRITWDRTLNHTHFF